MIKIIFTYFILIFILAAKLLSFPVINILNCDTSEYPLISSKILFINSDLIQIQNFNLLIKDNNIPVNPVGISCPQADIFDSLSFIFTFDLAAGNTDDSGIVFETSKNYLKQIIGFIDFSKSDAALLSFDNLCYLNEDFTKNREDLIQSANELFQSRFSYFDEGLLSTPVGALHIGKTDNRRKIIILITDRKDIFSADSVIQIANSSDIKIFCIFLGSEAPTDLKRICDETGGLLFDNADSKNIIKIAASVIALSKGCQPCNVKWNSPDDCSSNHRVGIVNIESSDSDFVDYNLDLYAFPYIETNPFDLSFSGVVPSSFKDLPITITARVKDIMIEKFIINHPYFNIVSGNNTNLLLKKDSSYTLIIRYQPADSNIVITKLEIKSNACKGTEVLIGGGYPNMPPQQRNLELTNPKCGEKLIIGDSSEIEWKGLLPRDIIQLEYTLNGGINWDTITPNASGLRISWKFPEIESDRCLIRGVQLWPNNIGKTMDLRHRQAVNSAFFNKDGSLIITACKDSCAYIWQSNIGAVLHKLEGHTGAVNWAVISPDEKYAATASEDSTAILWDILKSQKIKTLAAHTDNVRTVCFSPDSKYLVSAGHDGNAIIWDVLTGQIKNTIKASNSQLWFSEFSPSGDYIVMGGIDSYVKFWDMKTETFTKSINTGNGYNSFGAISRDGSKLVTASLFGRAVVWDIAAGDSIAGFSHEDSSKIPPILYADFDKTGDTLLTSSVDRIVKMWCISTNKLVSNFQEHTNTVKTAVFNFDNSRALTASWDGAAKYWNREKRDLQTDSTDCFFSIVKAGAELRNIDFGKVVVSEYKDSIVDFFVINKTNAPYRISNFRLWGAAKDDFIIHNFRADSVIDSGSYLPLEITFKPGVFGARQAFIDITIPGDSVLHCSITGEGTDYELGIDAPVIDFANTTLGDVKDTIVYPLLTNKINSPLNIYSVKILGTDKDDFSILSGGSATVLNSFESLSTAIRFMPGIPGRKKARIVFEHSGAESPSKIFLYGFASIPRIDTAIIAISDAHASAGDIIEIPIYYRKAPIFPIEAPDSLSVTLKFNASLLEPLFGAASDTIINGFRTLIFTVPARDSILNILKFSVGFGNDSISSLELDNVFPLSKWNTKIYVESGLFRLDGLCRDGGTRLFDPDGFISLAQNKPNPFQKTTIIEFDVLEPGKTRLYLINSMGNIERTILDSYLASGKYQIELNSDGLASGLYFYILETPSRRISRKLLLDK